MTTAHAYIADLNRERPTNANRAEAVALLGVCGAPERDGSELRCFGLRRLATVWPAQGHNVTCPACRAEVRRLLAGRSDPAHEERIAALGRWVAQHPDARGLAELRSHAADVQRRRDEAAVKRARAEALRAERSRAAS